MGGMMMGACRVWQPANTNFGRRAKHKRLRWRRVAVDAQHFDEGYGFVRFSEESDQQRALVEMQGVYCGNRPMRISTATPKTRSHQYGHGHNGNQMPPGPVPGAHTPAVSGWGMPPQFYSQPAYNPMQPMNQFTDPHNTTVFVGGLSGYVTEDELRSFFQGLAKSPTSRSPWQGLWQPPRRRVRQAYLGVGKAGSHSGVLKLEYHGRSYVGSGGGSGVGLPERVVDSHFIFVQKCTSI